MTNYATMTDLFNALTYSLSSAQLEVLTNVTANTGQIMAVGLAGLDLTDFYTYCYSSTSACKSNAGNYNAYDGYALVSYIYDSSSNSATTFGACFDDDSYTSCWTADSSGTSYSFNTIQLSANASATNPSDMTTSTSSETCTTNTGGFTFPCFGFNSCTVASYACTVYRFMETTSTTTRYSSGQSMTVVAIN